MTIYFVDEEIGGRSAYPIALKSQGWQVRTLPDAARALDVLPQVTDIELVFIDVMLAPGLQGLELFRPQDTRNGLETGLMLLRELAARKPSICARAVLLSAATDDVLVAKIRSVGRSYKVPYWRKGSFRTPADFCRNVREVLEPRPPKDDPR